MQDQATPYPPGHPYARIATGEEAKRLQKLLGIGPPPPRQLPTKRYW